MARTKQGRSQRKVASNLVQILPTRPAAEQLLPKNVDPPPVFCDTPPSEPIYLSFSELYCKDASSLRSSSAETLVSDYSPVPMDWDRETLYDPTASFRDSFYGCPHEDDLPIPGKDFIFGTPFIPDSPTPPEYSSPSLCGHKLTSTLSEDILMVDSFPALEEDIVMDTLRNEFEEKLTVEPTVIAMEVDVEIAAPAVPPPTIEVLSRQSNLAPPAGCARSPKLRSRSSARYDTSRSLTKRRFSAAPSVAQSLSVKEIKEPSRALSPTDLLSKLLCVPRSVAKDLLPPPPPPPAPRRQVRVLESLAGPIAKERTQYRQQHAFNCERDENVYEPNLEALPEARRDIESHENEECPSRNIESESKKVSAMRKMVSTGSRWMKKAQRVHQELKRRK